jgi:hypothetical protein
LDDGQSAISQVDFASTTARGLEDEARRIVARAEYNPRSELTPTGNVALPFRMPREADPSIWSVGVKVRALHCL